MMAKRPFAFGPPLPVGAVVLLAALGLAAPGWSAARDRFDRGEVSIAPVSNPHPDLVSGGQVLLRVTTPRRVSASHVRITLNSVDVTSDFARQADGSLLGLVTGLRDGPNVVRADTGDGFREGRAARLVVVNHPIPSAAAVTPAITRGPAPGE